jgi:hypothetical protein
MKRVGLVFKFGFKIPVGGSVPVIFISMFRSRSSVVFNSKKEIWHMKSTPSEMSLKAIFHCGRFARAGGATNFNHVKNQSRGHVKKVECGSTFMACPREFKRTINAQDR